MENKRWTVVKYQYEMVVLQVGPHQIPRIRVPDEIEMVGIFLGSDVQDREGMGNFFLEAIENVLSGKEEYDVVSGNVCGLEIRKDCTRVIDNLADDGIGNACLIETEELKKLIEVWLDHLDKFWEERN
jgi:hypothetical protein